MPFHVPVNSRVRILDGLMSSMTMHVHPTTAAAATAAVRATGTKPGSIGLSQVSAVCIGNSMK